VSLEGSLETVALPEVLNLLSDRSKTGELHVAGARASGQLWFDAGHLAGFEVGRCEHAVDALFDLLRNEGGDFRFTADAPLPDTACGCGATDGDIRPALKQAEARLVEWAEIVAVVPSLDHEVFLAASAPGAEVLLDAAQWAMVVAIGEGRTVHDVLDHLGAPEFDGCRSIKGLVDAALVDVFDPRQTGDADTPAADDGVLDAESDQGLTVDASSDAAGDAREALSALIDGLVPNGTNGSQAEADTPATVSGDAADHDSGLAADTGTVDGAAAADSEADVEAEAEPINRGLLLKFLSSVRS